MKRTTILSIFKVNDVNEHEKIREMISRGLDVDAVDSGGRTLLMEAAIMRDKMLVKELYDLGANVNLHDNRNWTALHFAAQNDDVEMAKLLLDNGADVDPKDAYGNTPLIRAIMNFRASGELIRELKERGADIDLKNNSGISPLKLARSISNFEIVPFVEGR